MNRSFATLLVLTAVIASDALAQRADSTRIPLTIPGRAAPDSTPSASDRAFEHYRRGRAFEDAGRQAAALSSYQNCVLADGTFPDAYYRLGMLFLGAQNVEEARQCFEAELGNTPAHEQASRELGLVLARLGRAREGIPRLEAYRDRHPEEGLAWYALGFAYMQAERPADAERALRRAIAIGPPNPVWHRDLGSVLAARGEDAEARREYATALKINPENPTTLINLGNLERRAGRAAQALEAYRRAEAIDSTLNIALNGQAIVLRDLGRHDEAAAVYRRWLARRPGDHGARLDAVRFFQGIELPDQGVTLAREGVARDRQSGDARVVLAIALEGVGRRDEALRELGQARGLFQTPAERARADQLIRQLTEAGADSSGARSGGRP
jgi:tetratricopeptide (TPR) repeat protein